MHDVVVVGGGAAGLELVTRLGDRFGRRGQARITLVERARTHLWKPMLHAVAAGSMDPGEHELNYLAQAHWHHFRYRLGDLAGLDRAAHEVRLAAMSDDEGREITPRAQPALRHPGDRDREHYQRFRRAGRRAVRGAAGNPAAGRALQPPPGRTPAFAPTPSPARCGPASCMWR